jgi:cytochrome c biogenesis protein CcmG/thiol:disulfide interchange protein DsbE
MKKWLYFLPIILFIVLGVFLFRGITLDPSEMPSALINKPVPTFSLADLQDGSVITEKALQGHVTLLNVWATWCVSCRMEHLYLVELAQHGVNIIGVDYKDDDAQARGWLKELGNPYALVAIDKEGYLGLDLGVFGAPETFLVDKHGIIRYKRVGVIDERVWQQEILPVYISLNQQP